MHWKNRVDVTPAFCILWAWLLLVLPLRPLAAALAAALVHELCHMLAIRLTGGKILGLTVGAGGMRMEIAPMGPGRELICALAGPAGSFLLVPMGQWFPFVSVCAFTQGCFNLLPLYPLDGGRTIRCLVRLMQKYLAKKSDSEYNR